MCFKLKTPQSWRPKWIWWRLWNRWFLISCNITNFIPKWWWWCLHCSLCLIWYPYWAHYLSHKHKSNESLICMYLNAFLLLSFCFVFAFERHWVGCNIAIALKFSDGINFTCDYFCLTFSWSILIFFIHLCL